MNNRMLGIAGSALLIIGFFMPIISVVIISFSYFSLVQLAPGVFFTGILLLILGIVSLLLALKNSFKPLIATGIVSLCLLAFDFYRLRSGFSAAAGGGDSETGGDIGRGLAEASGIGFGMYIMAIAAILLIVAGIMKSKTPAPAYAGGPPPPYPPVG